MKLTMHVEFDPRELDGEELAAMSLFQESRAPLTPLEELAFSIGFRMCFIRMMSMLGVSPDGHAAVLMKHWDEQNARLWSIGRGRPGN